MKNSSLAQILASTGTTLLITLTLVFHQGFEVFSSVSLIVLVYLASTVLNIAGYGKSAIVQFAMWSIAAIFALGNFNQQDVGVNFAAVLPLIEFTMFSFFVTIFWIKRRITSSYSPIVYLGISLLPALIAVVSMVLFGTSLAWTPVQQSVALGIAFPVFVGNIAALIFSGQTTVDSYVLACRHNRSPPSLFGPGKTVSGTVAALLVATATAFLFRNSLALSLTVGIGAVLGDLLGSAIKRKLGLARGSPVAILDQLDSAFFVYVAVFLIFDFELPIEIGALVLVFSLSCQLLGNLFARVLGIKSVAW